MKLYIIFIVVKIKGFTSIIMIGSYISQWGLFKTVKLVQSVGDVEYTDCFSTERVRPPLNECPT